jgi:hypothetical protein
MKLKHFIMDIAGMGKKNYIILTLLYLVLNTVTFLKNGSVVAHLEFWQNIL